MNKKHCPYKKTCSYHAEVIVGKVKVSINRTVSLLIFLDLDLLPKKNE